MTLQDFTIEELQDEIRSRMGRGRISTRSILMGDLSVMRASEKYGVSQEIILGRDRSALASEARMYAMWRMHEAGYSYLVCGRYFGRDHTTIIHAVKKMKKANQ